LFALSATYVSPGRASAQDPPGEYVHIIEGAVEEFGAGRWAEANALFERAHALYPNARTLRGMGMCAFELRRYADAIRFLDWSLGEQRRELTEGQRDETMELLSRARAYVGHFEVTTVPAGAEVSVDGEVPERGAEGRLVLSVGDHTIIARAPGHRDARRTVSVGGGEDESFVLELESTGIGDPSEGALALFIAGAAFALFEPIGIGWFVDRDSEVASCANPMPGFSCANAGALEEQRDVSIIVSIAAAGAALTLGVAGLIAWLAFGGSSGGSAGLECGAQPGGLACRF